MGTIGILWGLPSEPLGRLSRSTSMVGGLRMLKEQNRERVWKLFASYQHPHPLALHPPLTRAPPADSLTLVYSSLPWLFGPFAVWGSLEFWAAWQFALDVDIKHICLRVAACCIAVRSHIFAEVPHYPDSHR